MDDAEQKEAEEPQRGTINAGESSEVCAGNNNMQIAM